jgi:putative transposase
LGDCIPAGAKLAARRCRNCGRIHFNRQKINLSQVFVGQTVGIKQTDEPIWLVSFMDCDLG